MIVTKEMAENIPSSSIPIRVSNKCDKGKNAICYDNEGKSDNVVLQAMQVCPQPGSENSRNDPELETRYIYTNSATSVQSTNLHKASTRVSDQLNELSDINITATKCVAEGRNVEKNVDGQASNFQQLSDETHMQGVDNQVSVSPDKEGGSLSPSEDKCDDLNQKVDIKTENSSNRQTSTKRITRSSMNSNLPEDVVLTLRQTHQELINIRLYLDARMPQRNGAGDEKNHTPGSTIQIRPESTANIMQTKLQTALERMDQLSYLVYMRSLAESLATERIRKMEEDICQLRVENTQLQVSLSPKNGHKKSEISKRLTNRMQTQKHTVMMTKKQQICFNQDKRTKRKPNLPKAKSLRILTRGKPFKCEICSKCFATKNTLNIHYSAHTDEKPFQCSVCLRNFKQEAHMKKHKCGKDYSCDLCNRHFLWPSELEKHVMTHLPVKQYQCKTCGKCFTVDKYLKQHEHLHSGRKRHVCDICGKGFNQLGNLRQHKNRHLGLKPYQCDICGKSFPCYNDLSRHKMSHSDAKPFSCNFCELKFRRRDYLKIHEMSHTGEKPYICEVCGMRFKTSQFLNKHMKMGKHTGKNRLRRPQLDCDVCGRHFRSSSKLADHKSFHSSTTMYQCDTCGKSYKTNRALKTHKREHRQIVNTSED